MTLDESATSMSRAEASEANAPQPDAEEAPTKSIANDAVRVIGELALLMASSPAHRHLFLADLEWLLLPPVMLKQVRLVRDERKRLIAAAFWASVSEEVDDDLGKGRTRLKPAEWNSGERLWLMDVVGPGLMSDPKQAERFIALFAREAFNGRPFKLRRANPKTGRSEIVEIASKPKQSGKPEEGAAP